MQSSVQTDCFIVMYYINVTGMTQIKIVFCWTNP